MVSPTEERLDYKSFGNNWDLDVGLRYILSDIEEVDHIGTANMGLHYYY